MDGKFSWLLCRVLKSGELVSVRQDPKNRDRFLDGDGDVYHITELDLTDAVVSSPNTDFISDMQERMRKSDEEHARMQSQLHDMLSSLDAKGIADHQAVIDERAYWRKLRGDVFMKILDRGGSFTKLDELKWACNMTDMVINDLYKQDSEKFKNEEK